MAINSVSSDGLHRRATLAWRVLLAGLVAVAIALGGAAYAANNSVQGAKKADEQARRQAVVDVGRQREEEQARAEAEAKHKAEEELRLKAEEEARRKSEEEAKRKRHQRSADEPIGTTERRSGK